MTVETRHQTSGKVVISARGLLQKAAPFSTQLSSMGTMVVNGKVQCRLCSKYPSCRWSPVCVAARGESKVNVMGGLADSLWLLSDLPLRTSEYRLNLARSRETDRRQCHENRSPVFSHERSPTADFTVRLSHTLYCFLCIAALISALVIFQWVNFLWKLLCCMQLSPSYTIRIMDCR